MASVRKSCFCNLFLSFAILSTFCNFQASTIVVQEICNPNPCLNGGLCGASADSFLCTCINGYIGIRCEGRSDECPLLEAVKCVNGQCKLDSSGTPKCECNGHFGGQYCDVSLDTCKHGLCQGGLCVDTQSGYKCKCPPGKQGRNCQIDQLVTERCLDDCRTNGTGSNGGRCWHNTSETVNVGWGYSQPLCSTKESCFDMSTKKYDYIDVQLKPIQLQPNDTLIFQTNTDASLFNNWYVPQIVPMEVSSMDSFTTCNATNAVPLANYNWVGPGKLKVNASFLHLGTQYFIANVNSLYRCEFGLRLNVTVKANQCFDFLSPGTEMCHGHGKCYTDFSRKAYECSCCTGYTGKYCENEDPCFVNPCRNDGKCSIIRDARGKTTFRCSCSQGFHGYDCSQIIDVCESNPCLNSGVCVANGTGFSCQCTGGYYGEICQNTNDQCANNPCLNSGTCIDGDNSFTCQCINGYKGPKCEVNINECATNPCHNGTCIDGINSFQCYCQPGYTGLYCETQQEQCDDIPCNAGQCVKIHGSSQCSCGFGFTGSRCEIDLSLCQNSVLCLEESSLACIDHGNHVTCRCKDGYGGSNCGVDVDDCETNPCQNGGKCIDKLNKFECLCGKGTRGRLCDVMDQRPTEPATTGYQPSTKSPIQTTNILPLEIKLDLKLVTDNCPKLQEPSALESFTKSLTDAIQNACSCILSASKISPSSSSIICSGKSNGKFVTKLRVKDKEEEKKIICGLVKKLKKGNVHTSDEYTYLIEVNSDSSMCQAKEDYNGPVAVDKSVYNQNSKIGIIVGSVAAVIIIVITVLMVSVKFRNKAIHPAKEGNDAKTFLNFAYQNDLELISPKSAWSTPDLSSATRDSSRSLSYAIKQPKKYHETSFSFENPGGQTSTV